MAAIEEITRNAQYPTIEVLSDQEPRGVLAGWHNVAEDRVEASNKDSAVAAGSGHDPSEDHHICDAFSALPGC